MRFTQLVATLAVVSALVAPAFTQAQTTSDPARGGAVGGGMRGGPAGGIPRGGHFTGPDGSWSPHPAWTGGGRFTHWRAGHWWRGTYGGRYGAWWIVGPDWYWYPEEVAPIPDPYTPPGMTAGYWYWCDEYQAYYPYVGACPSGWRQTQPL